MLLPMLTNTFISNQNHIYKHCNPMYWKTMCFVWSVPPPSPFVFVFVFVSVFVFVFAFVFVFVFVFVIQHCTGGDQCQVPPPPSHQCKLWQSSPRSPNALSRPIRSQGFLSWPELTNRVTGITGVQHWGKERMTVVVAMQLFHPNPTLSSSSSTNFQ